MSIWSPAPGSPSRVNIPKGGQPPKEKEPVGPERLLQALQTMDANAAERMRDLKVFLFVLPILWGLIWGVVYVAILVMR